MKAMLVLATALSVIPLVLSVFMPNWYLGDQQNAVEEAGLVDRCASPPSEDEEDDLSRGSDDRFWSGIRGRGGVEC